MDVTSDLDVTYEKKSKKYVVTNIIKQTLSKEEMINFVKTREQRASSIKRNLEEKKMKKKNISKATEAFKNKLKAELKSIKNDKHALKVANEELGILNNAIKNDEAIKEWLERFDNLSKEFQIEQGTIRKMINKSQAEFQKKLELGKKL